jgi:hypothetical protein
MYNNLPRKFQSVNENEVIIVRSTGALEVVQTDVAYFHDSQWTHYDGRGGRIHDWWYTADDDIDKLKVQGIGRRWTYLPWTKEQEVSCRPMRLRLRMNTESPEIDKNREELNTKSMSLYLSVISVKKWLMME